MAARDWLSSPKHFKILLLIPLQVLVNAIAIFPLSMQVFVSVTDWSPRLGLDWWASQFVGLQNYLTFPTDPLFLSAIARTMAIVGSAVTLEFFIGLGLALIFVQRFFGRGVFTTALIIPLMIVPAVNGYMFYLMFLSSGPFNALLTAVTGQYTETSWLTSALTATIVVIISDVWQWTPFVFLIMLSGLLALPRDPVDAARVFGASSAQVFRYIMLPLLKPIIVVVLLLRSIEAFKLFDAVWVMTAGGPGYSTQTISVYLYEEGFRYMKLAYIAAESLIILIVMAVLAWFVVKKLKVL